MVSLHSLDPTLTFLPHDANEPQYAFSIISSSRDHCIACSQVYRTAFLLALNFSLNDPTGCIQLRPNDICIVPQRLRVVIRNRSAGHMKGFGMIRIKVHPAIFATNKSFSNNITQCLSYIWSAVALSLLTAFLCLYILYRVMIGPRLVALVVIVQSMKLVICYKTVNISSGYLVGLSVSSPRNQVFHTLLLYMRV